MRHWKKILWGALCLVSLTGFLLMNRADHKVTATLLTQQAAIRWGTPEKPYAMASVFLEPSQSIAPSRIGEIYLSVEKAMTAGGVSSENYPWIYAASYHTDAELKNGTVTCPVELTAVAGDFFEIHPFPLMSGWYLDEKNVMRDRIVLDRQAAWKLFYSDNVYDQFVTMDGKEYQVAAVVDIRTGDYNIMAAGDTCRAWILADKPQMPLAQEGNEGASSDELGYTCVEMVLPQPVKNFAAATLKAALGDMVPDTTVITDNSERFSLKNRWIILRNFATRGISSDAVPYPFWENAARLVENHLAIRLIPEGVLLAFPALSLLILLLWLNHKRTWGLHSLRDLAENAVDRRRQIRYEAQLSGVEPKKLGGRMGQKKTRRKSWRETRRESRRRQKALKYASKRERGRKR